MPSENYSKTVKLWMNTTAKDYQRQLKSSWGEVGRKVAILSKISKEDFVLDIGCGTGRCTIFVKFEIGAEILGVDMSIQRLKILRNLSYKANIPVVLADATKLPFRDKLFDKVISNEVWIHIPTSKGRKDYISEIARVIKTNGNLFISGVYVNLLPKDTWKRDSKGCWYAHTFSITEIIASFIRAGLKNLKVHPSLISRCNISRRTRYVKTLHKNCPNILKPIVAWCGFKLIDIET